MSESTTLFEEPISPKVDKNEVEGNDSSKKEEGNTQRVYNQESSLPLALSGLEEGKIESREDVGNLF